METQEANAELVAPHSGDNAEPSKLVSIIESTAVAKDTAADLKSNFSSLFAQADEWLKRVPTIKITDVSQIREMKLARETRLAIREIRIEAENKRKSLKEDSLRRGRAIDGICNVLKAMIEPAEEYLKGQEEFAERAEEKRLSDLKDLRAAQLSPYGVDASFYALDRMPEESFAQLLENTKAAHEAKLAAARKQEEDRIRLENERLQREKEEAAERERIRLENERLRREAKEREESARLEREAREKERLEAEAKAAAERRELEEKARREREALEAQAAKERKEAEERARSEREARERLEREIKAKEDAEKKRLQKEVADRKRLAMGPDIDKLRDLSKRVQSLELPEMSSLEGEAALATIKTQILNLVRAISQEAESLSK